MKVLDTSIAVDHLRGLPAATDLLAGLVTSGEPVAASELVRFELLAGVREEEIEGLESFFQALSWLPVTEDVSRLGGELARRFRRSHTGIDDADYLIAATTLLHDAELLTTNIRHFPMLPGLRPPY